EERVAGYLGRRGDLDAFAAHLRPPGGRDGREEEPLPGVRADRVAEEQIVVPPPQPVAARSLIVPPTAWQLPDLGDLLVDDGPVSDGGADHATAVGDQRVDQGLKSRAIEDDRMVVGGGRGGHRRQSTPPGVDRQSRWTVSGPGRTSWNGPGRTFCWDRWPRRRGRDARTAARLPRVGRSGRRSGAASPTTTRRGSRRLSRQSSGRARPRWRNRSATAPAS